MRGQIVLLLLLFFGNYVFAQQPKETSNIFLGTNYGLRQVANDSFIFDTTFILNVSETVGALNNKVGRLLLYTNQEIVKDSNHKVVSQGLFKNNISAMQGAFFYQHPERNYIDFFTNMGGSSSVPKQGLYHHYIEYNGDTIINHGLNNLLHDSTNEAMGVMRHENGRDLWIVTQSYWNDSIYIDLLTKSGLCPCSRKFKSFHNNKSIFSAYSKVIFHPTGKYFLLQFPTTNPDKAYPFVYSFNSQNGVINQKFQIPFLYPQSGMSVSNENTSFFSVADVLNDIVYIYSHKIKISDSSATSNSRKLIKTATYQPSGKNRITDFQKVSPTLTLVTRNLSDYISAIKLVNDTWTFIDTFLYQPGIKGNYRFPTFDESIFYTPSINYTYDLDCRTNTIHFEGKDTFGATKFTYIVKKQGQLMGNLIGSKNKSYTFTDTGVFEVSFIAKSRFRTDTVTKTIEVLPKIPANFLGADRAICTPDTAVLLAAPQGLHCYRWHNLQGQEMGSSYSLLAKNQGTYICTATDNNFCSVKDTVYLGIDTLKKAKLQRSRDTLFIANAPTTNNANYHWYKNGSGHISLLKPALTLTGTGQYFAIITQDSLCPTYTDTLQIDSLYGPNSILQIPTAGLKIYPNPAQDYLTIDWQGTETLVLQLFDALGKVVLNTIMAPKNIKLLNISTLSKGVYLLQVNGEFGVKVVLE